MKNSPERQRHFFIALLVVISGASVSAAVVFPFTGVSNNSVANTLTGQAQFSVEVEQAGAGDVRFIFHNSGPDQSSITQVYFDNGPAGTGAVDSITGFSYSNAGISYSIGATPANLPGGNTLTPAFVATAGLTAGPGAPPVHNGVNPNEWMGILTTLATPYSYADVLDQISSGVLRIGIHAQGFADGGSESFVTTWLQPAPIVPTPGSLLLTTLGLGVIRVLRYRVAVVWN